MSDICLVKDEHELKRIIDTLKEQIAKAQMKYESKLKEAEDTNEDRFCLSSLATSQDIHSQVLLATQKRLTAEKDSQASNPPVVEDPPELKPIVEYQLRQSLDALQKLTTTLKLRKAHLKATLERLDIAIERDTKMEEALRKKLDEERKMSEQYVESDGDETNKLKEKIKRVKLRTKEISIQMAHFLDEHFSPAVDMKAMKSEKITRDHSPQSTCYLSMSEIIEKLANVYLDTPEDCYVEVDETWWPPHLETLLRCGIVVQHPDTPNKVRLDRYGIT